MLPCFFVSLAFLLAQLLAKCLAVSINRTIDDTNGDPITGFIPKYSSGWHSDPLQGLCSPCPVQPDESQVFQKTWHDTTNEVPGATLPSVTLEFTGTAIYLFCIVPNTVPNYITVVNLQFTLDNATAGTYQHFQNKSNVFEYSVPVLSLENLANKPHTLVAEVIFGSLVLFDYANYT
ncbi:hypothetical protein GGX14DRAFT_368421 [Mycena pura]|uniref:Uncharacterized protein n=1 Tax=Mycena pura TaxID=153505 RepID=A0AAD6YDY6_9AGAR|nr:hypothetical protein GGX14DRAFT_368421 [Mycena pura]